MPLPTPTFPQERRPQGGLASLSAPPVGEIAHWEDSLCTGGSKWPPTPPPLWGPPPPPLPLSWASAAAIKHRAPPPPHHCILPPHTKGERASSVAAGWGGRPWQEGKKKRSVVACGGPWCSPPPPPAAPPRSFGFPLVEWVTAGHGGTVVWREALLLPLTAVVDAQKWCLPAPLSLFLFSERGGGLGFPSASFPPLYRPLGWTVAALGAFLEDHTGCHPASFSFLLLLFGAVFFHLSSPPLPHLLRAESILVSTAFAMGVRFFVWKKALSTHSKREGEGDGGAPPPPPLRCGAAGPYPLHAFPSPSPGETTTTPLLHIPSSPPPLWVPCGQWGRVSVFRVWSPPSNGGTSPAWVGVGEAPRRDTAIPSHRHVFCLYASHTKGHRTYFPSRLSAVLLPFRFLFLLPGEDGPCRRPHWASSLGRWDTMESRGSAPPG